MDGDKSIAVGAELEDLNIEYTPRDIGQIFDIRWVLKVESKKMKKISKIF